MAKYTIKQAMWLTAINEIYDKVFETDDIKKFIEQIDKNIRNHGKGRLTLIKSIKTENGITTVEFENKPTKE